MADTTAPVDLEDLRQRVKDDLRADRAIVRGRGHDWDVADAADVVVREYGGYIVPAAGQSRSDDAELRRTVLATGSDLRRAVSAAQSALSGILDRVPSSTALHADLMKVYRMLDVPTAEERLARPLTAAPGVRPGPRPSAGVGTGGRGGRRKADDAARFPTPAVDLAIGGNG